MTVSHLLSPITQPVSLAAARVWDTPSPCSVVFQAILDPIYNASSREGNSKLGTSFSFLRGLRLPRSVVNTVVVNVSRPFSSRHSSHVTVDAVNC
ncbi:unnamed protein product [Linum trigynum]